MAPQAAPASTSVSAASAHWFNITRVATHPEGRNRGVFVDDPIDGSVLLFGGYDAAGAGWLGDTWTTTGAAWTPLSPVTAPGARSSAAAAFDPALGGVVVFGGFLFGAASPYYNDTWLFKLGAWSHLSTAVTPPARSEAAMAYDPLLGELVLFGGVDSTSLRNDTWAYGSGGWTQLSLGSSPPRLSGAAMAYDAPTARLVLYGGTLGSSDSLGTWTFNGNWTSLPGATTPGGLYLPAMAALPNGTAVLAGGSSSGASEAPVVAWEWAGSGWVTMGAGPGPSSRVGPMMTYDSTDGYTLLFGGRNFTGGAGGPSLNDSWALDTLSAQLPAFSSTGVAPFTVTPTAIVVGGPLNFDGSSSVTFQWGFGDGSTSTSGTPTHTYNVAGDDTIRLALFDGLGLGLGLSTTVSVTFLLNIAIVSVASPELTYGFSATSANSTGAVSLAWQFGDGTTSTSATPTHTYPSSGPVTVRVTGTDSANAAGSGVRSFSVPAGLAVQLQAASTATVGSPAHFSASATGGAGGYEFTWNFSDGTVATGPSVTHTFGSASAGVVTGHLTVQDANGSAQELTFHVDVAAGSGSGSGGAALGSGDPTTQLYIALGIAVGAGAALGALVGLLGRSPAGPRTRVPRARPPRSG
ncbi:MAG: PKD domain-containing protein [Thermoplasmata archaeon]|nr:PKD domain-containing protein [Thermoplasmata archaeon]MCI4355791.1 PKD domain-containing protein [Thermoplasmata archaeon]